MTENTDSPPTECGLAIGSFSALIQMRVKDNLETNYIRATLGISSPYNIYQSLPAWPVGRARRVTVRMSKRRPDAA